MSEPTNVAGNPEAPNPDTRNPELPTSAGSRGKNATEVGNSGVNALNTTEVGNSGVNALNTTEVGNSGVSARQVPTRVIFARVDDTEISVAECERAVASAEAGAVVTFAGVVRDHDEGRGVSTLDYTAHPSANDVIRQVAESVAAEHPAVTIAVSHRVGHLVVGDIALACAVASAHRAEAFAACARLVDAVKESVPIWKNQAFTDGSSEWVASLG